MSFNCSRLVRVIPVLAFLIGLALLISLDGWAQNPASLDERIDNSYWKLVDDYWTGYYTFFPKHDPNHPENDTFDRLAESLWQSYDDDRVFVTLDNGLELTLPEAKEAANNPANSNSDAVFAAVEQEYRSMNLPVENPATGSSGRVIELTEFIVLVDPKTVPSKTYEFLRELFTSKRLPAGVHQYMGLLVTRIEREQGLSRKETQARQFLDVETGDAFRWYATGSLLGDQDPEIDTALIDRYQALLETPDRLRPNPKEEYIDDLAVNLPRYADTSSSKQNLEKLADLIDTHSDGYDEDVLFLRTAAANYAGRNVSELVELYATERTSTLRKSVLARLIVGRLGRGESPDNWETDFVKLVRAVDRERQLGTPEEAQTARELMDEVIYYSGLIPKESLPREIEDIVNQDPQYYKNLGTYYLSIHVDRIYWPGMEERMPRWNQGGSTAIRSLLALDLSGEDYLFPRKAMFDYLKNELERDRDGRGIPSDLLTAVLRYIELDRNEVGSMTEILLQALQTSPPSEVTRDQITRIKRLIAKPESLDKTAMDELATLVLLMLGTFVDEEDLPLEATWTPRLGESQSPVDPSVHDSIQKDSMESADPGPRKSRKRPNRANSGRAY